ncbi:MAG: TIGR01777 family oxidoreductase [Gemmatimonadota bacterium]|nr:MAG: TIGR01777 family oxidoreductase [Gemmatimonadota bacterium]
MSQLVIVTGASGFIGRILCASLIERGYTLVALSRNPEKGRDMLGDKVQVVFWDGRSAEGWGHYADGAYAIVNLAGDNIGSGKWTKEKKQSILQSRLNAGRAVVDAVKQAQNKPKVVLQASGIGVYGDRGDERCDESTPLGTGFLPDVGRQWEASTQGVTDFGVRHAIIRTGVVLGKNDGFLPRNMLPFRLFLGGHFGSGKQWLSWIHIDDEARAIRFLMENEKAQGVFNLNAPNPLMSKEFAKTLGRSMKRPSWLPVPGFLLRLLFGEMADALILSGQRGVPKRLLDLGFEFQYPELESALRNILKT